MKTKVETILWFVLFVLAISPCPRLYAEGQDRIVYASASWVPYAYVDKDGTARGVYVDILKAVFEDGLSIQVDYQEYPWKRAQALAKDGLVDIFITVATAERLQYMVKSKSPVLAMYLHVYTYAGHPQLAAIQEIRSGEDVLELGLIPVTNLGNVWHRNNIDRLGVQTHYVPSEDNAFLFLAARLADITIEPLTAGNYLINKLDLSAKVIPTEGRFGPITFHLLVSRQSPFVHRIGEIDHVIDELRKSGKISAIIDHYRRIK